MNKIKIFFVGMAALVCGNVMAQKITAADVTIAPGATADLVFSVESEAVAALAEFELKLPTGLTIDNKSAVAGELFSDTHESTVSTKKKSGNTYVLVMSKEGDEFTAASGKLITLTMTAAADLAEGDYTIEMQKINLTNLKAEQINSAENETGTIKVTVAATGINSLNADDSNEPAFNLAGQKVGKNYKGIVVKNGKKTIVK